MCEVEKVKVRVRERGEIAKIRRVECSGRGGESGGVRDGERGGECSGEAVRCCSVRRRRIRGVYRRRERGVKLFVQETGVLLYSARANKGFIIIIFCNTINLESKYFFITINSKK